MCVYCGAAWSKWQNVLCNLHTTTHIYLHSTLYSVCAYRSRLLTGKWKKFLLRTVRPLQYVVNKVDAVLCLYSFPFCAVGVGYGGSFARSLTFSHLATHLHSLTFTHTHSHSLTHSLTHSLPHLNVCLAFGMFWVGFDNLHRYCLWPKIVMTVRPFSNPRVFI